MEHSAALARQTAHGVPRIERGFTSADVTAKGEFEVWTEMWGGGAA